MVLSSSLFLQKGEKSGSEGLQFQRSELVHGFVADMGSGFSTSALVSSIPLKTGKTLVLRGLSGCVVNGTCLEVP